MAITSNVKNLMKKRKITCQELMAKAELSSQTVANARGPRIRECRIYTLEKIASVLGVRVRDLILE